MVEWFTDNLSSILVTAVLVLVVVLIIREMVKDRRTGKGGCGGNCSACGHCTGCGMPGKDGSLPGRPEDKG